MLTGPDDVVALCGGQTTLTDTSWGLTVSLGSLATAVTLSASNAGDFQIDLADEPGGPQSAAAAYALLTDDGAGGTILPLQGGNAIHILGLDRAELSAANFVILGNGGN
jgi:hypothetical protein